MLRQDHIALSAMNGAFAGAPLPRGRARAIRSAKGPAVQASLENHNVSRTHAGRRRWRWYIVAGAKKHDATSIAAGNRVADVRDFYRQTFVSKTAPAPPATSPPIAWPRPRRSPVGEFLKFARVLRSVGMRGRRTREDVSRDRARFRFAGGRSARGSLSKIAKPTATRGLG